ncbi:hypothetical protein JW899_01265 [Candidatus Uhrbacteria bacterium]|nr:hypothetical protein [Candidatus Uhrbacteria bacterium]
MVYLIMAIVIMAIVVILAMTVSIKKKGGISGKKNPRNRLKRPKRRHYKLKELRELRKLKRDAMEVKSMTVEEFGGWYTERKRLYPELYARIERELGRE